MEFKLVIDANVELAETPVWDARVKRLYWTDLFSGDVHRFDPATGSEEVYKTNALIGSAIPCADVDKLMVAIESGIYVYDMPAGSMTLIADPNNGNTLNRYNDTRVDARGRIFASTVARLYGTADYTPDMLGDFYMIDTDGSVKTVVAGINQFNAIVWNRDNTKMFVVDTYNQTLLVFDYDIEKGPVSEPRVAIDFKEQGMPDGMSIDVQDNIYVCHWTGIISVWDADCKLKETVKFPVEYACCTGFGGDDMKELYAASSKYCYGADELKKNIGAGGVFVARAETAGAPEHFYK